MGAGSCRARGAFLGCVDRPGRFRLATLRAKLMTSVVGGALEQPPRDSPGAPRATLLLGDTAGGPGRLWQACWALICVCV